MRKVRGLLFDFDGLLVDTESAILRAWQEAYEELGHSVPEDIWAESIGTRHPFDPLAYLEELTKQDLSGMAEQLWAREAELVREERLRPGVIEYVDEAGARGLPIAVVSSSSARWVREHLDRLGIGDRWDGFFCADDDVSVAKPSPILYEQALRALDLRPGEAIAFEDSPNGILAAKAAGIFSVAIPNSVTVTMDLSGADLFLGSLSDLALSELLARVEGCRQSAEE